MSFKSVSPANLKENEEFFNKKLDNLGHVLLDIKNNYETIAGNFEEKSHINNELSNKILLVEKDIDALQKNFEKSLENIDELENKINDFNKMYQELAGSINQIRMDIKELSKDSAKQSEDKKRFIGIFWHIVEALLLSSILFLCTLYFKSCSSLVINDLPNKEGGNVEYKNFNETY